MFKSCIAKYRVRGGEGGEGERGERGRGGGGEGEWGSGGVGEWGRGEQGEGRAKHTPVRYSMMRSLTLSSGGEATCIDRACSFLTPHSTP